MEIYKMIGRFEENKQISQLQDSLREANECLSQIYSHLGVEAFGKDIQEQAVKEIDRLMDYKRNKLFKNHWKQEDYFYEKKMSKQNYAVCCYTCEHNGQETCKGCNTILNGENEPYENWQLREDLCQKDKQIADLQHRLEVAERTTKLACDELRDLNYRIFDNADIDFEQQFEEQAKKEIKGE